MNSTYFTLGYNKYQFVSLQQTFTAISGCRNGVLLEPSQADFPAPKSIIFINPDRHVCQLVADLVFLKNHSYIFVAYSNYDLSQNVSYVLDTEGFYVMMQPENRAVDFEECRLAIAEGKGYKSVNFKKHLDYRSKLVCYLSRQEFEVFCLYMAEVPRKVICSELNISLAGIAQCFKNIKRKLNVHTEGQLILKASLFC